MTTPTPTPPVQVPTVTSIFKPGYKTTEFLVVLLTDIGVVTASITGNLSPKYAALAASISVAAYALSRGLAKLYPPKPAG